MLDCTGPINTDLGAVERVLESSRPIWHDGATPLQPAGLLNEASADCPGAATLGLKQPIRTSVVTGCVRLAGVAVQGVQQGHE